MPARVAASRPDGTQGNAPTIARQVHEHVSELAVLDDQADARRFGSRSQERSWGARVKWGTNQDSKERGAYHGCASLR